MEKSQSILGPAKEFNEQESSEALRKCKVHEQIHGIKVLQETKEHYYKRLVEAEEKLSIHEHYMFLVKRLDRGNLMAMNSSDNYEDRMVNSLVRDLEDSIAEKSPAPSEH